jgi:hypothetical protein
MDDARVERRAGEEIIWPIKFRATASGKPGGRLAFGAGRADLRVCQGGGRRRGSTALPLSEKAFDTRAAKEFATPTQKMKCHSTTDFASFIGSPACRAVALAEAGIGSPESARRSPH